MEVIEKLRKAKKRSEVIEVLTELRVLGKEESVTGNGLVGHRFFQTLSVAIDHLGQSLLGLLTTREQKDYLSVIFIEGPAIDSFLVLTKSFNNVQHYTADKLLMCLGEFLKSRQAQMLETICSTTVDLPDRSLLDRLSQAMVGLPEKVANHYKGAEPRLFTRDNLIRRLTSDIIKALTIIHLRISENQDCTMIFLSDLVGKLYTTGSGFIVWECLIPFLVTQTRKSFLWARICQKLIMDLPKGSLEAIVSNIMEKAESSESVHRLLGDLVVKSSAVDLIVTHKLLLVRFTENDRFLLNLLGYIAKFQTENQLLEKTTKKLADIWSDRSALNHMSQPQHLYISKAIVIAMRLMSGLGTIEEKSRIQMAIVTGLDSHLNSLSDHVRTVGLAVGEIASRLLKNNAELKTLRFDYEDTDETKCLKRLAKQQDTKNENKTVCDEFLSDFEDFLKIENEFEDPKLSETTVKSKSKTQLIEELDSDDEIESDNKEKTAETDDFPITEKPVKPPSYIRDAMELLFEEKSVFKFEAAFFNLESLIRAKAVGFDDVAVELAKILLHLEDRYALPSFEETRQSCLSACCVMAPETTVPFLAKQFYAAEYTLGHRELILTVLRRAAKELSGDEENEEKKRAVTEEIKSSKEWQNAIVERIAQKTRRFHTPAKKLEEKINRFAPVASLFFYPLMVNCDRPTERCFDLLGRDSFLLAHLLFTVAQVLQYARNCPVVNSMASTLLELIWSLRYHQEPHVRQSLIFSLLNVVSSVTPRILVVQFGEQMTETRLWLETVERDDCDAICQKLATQTLQMLHSRMREGIESVVSV